MSAGAECLVFIAAEGPSEIGDLCNPPQYRGSREGFMQPILRKLCGDRVRLPFDGVKITSIPKERGLDVSKGHGRKAAQALALAKIARANAVVFVKDVDKASGEKAKATERRRKQRDMRREIEDGFKEVVGAESVRQLVAMPSRMIESWALGDPDAFEANGYPRPTFKGRPEELWGDEKTPASNHPKRVLERALGRPAAAEVFADLARVADPDRLEESCPESFAPFARDVRRAVDDCLK